MDSPSFKIVQAALNQDNRSEIFGLTSFGGIYSISQDQPGSWVSYKPHLLASGLFAANHFTVAAYGDGRLALIATSLRLGGTIQWKSQVAKNGGWGPWQSLGSGFYRDVVANHNSDGTLEVVAVKNDGTLTSNRLKSDGTWTGWHSFNDLISNYLYDRAYAMPSHGDGSLQLFADIQGSNGAGVVNFYQSPDFEWSEHRRMVGAINSQDGLAAATLPNGLMVTASPENGSCTGFTMEEKNMAYDISSWKPLPDLPHPPCLAVLTSVGISANPTTIVAGNTSTLNLSIVANSSCYPLTVTLKDDSNTSLFSNNGTLNVFTVAPNKTTTYTYSATCQNMTKSNSTTVTVTPATQPYSNVIFYEGPYEDPDFPSQNQAFKLSLIFANTGNKASPSYTVNLSIDDGPAMPQTLPAIQPGQTATVQWSIPGQSDGTHEFTWAIPQIGIGNGFEISTF